MSHGPSFAPYVNGLIEPDGFMYGKHAIGVGMVVMGLEEQLGKLEQFMPAML